MSLARQRFGLWHHSSLGREKTEWDGGLPMVHPSHFHPRNLPPACKFQAETVYTTGRIPAANKGGEGGESFGSRSPPPLWIPSLFSRSFMCSTFLSQLKPTQFTFPTILIGLIPEAPPITQGKRYTSLTGFFPPESFCSPACCNHTKRPEGVRLRGTSRYL